MSTDWTAEYQKLTDPAYAAKQDVKEGDTVLLSVDIPPQAATILIELCELLGTGQGELVTVLIYDEARRRGITWAGSMFSVASKLNIDRPLED